MSDSISEPATPSRRRLGPITVADYHVAGQPVRIVTEGASRLEGGDALARRAWAARNLDELRRLLVNEPRGYAATLGCFVAQPGGSGADLDAVLFDQSGFETPGDHGAIALATWAVDTGLVPVDQNRAVCSIDTAPGRLVARARVDGVQVNAVSYTGPVSYVAGRYIPLQLASDVISVDIVYASAYLAAIDAGELGLAVVAENVAEFARLGREVGLVLRDNQAVVHPTDHRLSGFSGTVFYENGVSRGSDLAQKSVTISADGRICRSPSGTATSARVALLDSTAELKRGNRLINESLVGTVLAGRVTGDGEVGGIHGVVTEVTGTAHRIGEARLWLDEADSLGVGFQLM